MGPFSLILWDLTSARAEQSRVEQSGRAVAIASRKKWYLLRACGVHWLYDPRWTCGRGNGLRRDFLRSWEPQIAVP